MARDLRRLGYPVGRKRVRRLMRLMGLSAIYQKPRTSDPHPAHRVYPYLLRGLTIDRANQVWCADVTYIPMRRGFLYLVAVMDWWSRKVLAWRLSNTLEPEFCVTALEEALGRYGRPEIFNTDQGSQFTSLAFTRVLKDACVRISMDGKGRWMDNIMIERLWRILVIPSEWYEGFPMTLVESFCQGLPVIASRLGSIAEIVEDGVTGRHFRPGDAEGLVAKVRWALDHPEETRPSIAAHPPGHLSPPGARSTGGDWSLPAG